MTVGTKLNQLIAIEKGVRGDANTALTMTYQVVQKGEPFIGISRTYQPLNDGDIDLPPGESKRVQLNAELLIHDVGKKLGRLWDVASSKDATNTLAHADIVLEDGTVVAEHVPVTTMLWLEKQLVDLATLVGKLPTLDPARDWSYNNNVAAYESEVEETRRTRKIEEPLTLAPATQQHPAQVVMVTKDVPVGIWKTTHFSGALPMSRVNDLADRVRKLSEAVKKARETANITDVVDVRTGQVLIDYLLS
jgi:hypothetical protein